MDRSPKLPGYFWQNTGLMGIDQLLSDFGFDDIGKREAVGRWRDLLQSEFKTGMAGKRQLADKFRAERRKLESLFNEFHSESGNWAFAKKAFERRSTRNADIVGRLRAFAEQGRLIVKLPDLVSSYAHMHINRLVLASQRAHEFVLYDFLFQLYDSRRARSAHAGSPIPKS